MKTGQSEKSVDEEKDNDPGIDIPGYDSLIKEQKIFHQANICTISKKIRIKQLTTTISKKTFDNFTIIQRYEGDESIKTGKPPYFSGGNPVVSFRTTGEL